MKNNTILHTQYKLERVESSPPLSLDHYFKTVCYDGYVKYEEAEIHRSAIMQDFRDNKKKKKKKKKWQTGSHFVFF